MKVRIKFQKYGVMRFIGHLDMMRYFQKAMRRAEIDIRYTEGFSPHQIMSFAAPLGVGVTSDGEYLDIEVNSTRSSLESLKALNDVMVEGILVREYRRLPEGARNAMSSVAAADYTVHFKEPEVDPFTLSTLREALQGFLKGQDQILVTKQTKKGERQLDLKPLIFALQGIGEPVSNLCSEGFPISEAFPISEEHPGFYLKLNSGSSDNVKPELVLGAFFDWCTAQGICDISYGPAAMQIHRLEVYGRKEDGSLLPLGEFGQEIP